MPMSPRVKPVANVGCYLRAFQNACVCRIVQIKARGLSADQTDSNTRATATSIDRLASKVCRVYGRIEFNTVTSYVKSMFELRILIWIGVVFIKQCKFVSSFLA